MSFKKFGVILLIFILLQTTSCGTSRVSALDLFEEVNKTVSFDNCTMYTYIPDADNDTRNLLLSRIYSDGSLLPPEISLCDDYLIVLHNGNEIMELHIFRAVSAYDAPKLEDMLVARRDRMQNGEIYDYVDESSSERIASAMIITEGRFGILSVTDKNETIYDIAKRIS